MVACLCGRNIGQTKTIKMMQPQLCARLTSAFRGLTMGFSTRTKAQLKEKKQTLMSIDSPKLFFQEVKTRGEGHNAVSPRNLLHLFKRCTAVKDVHIAARAVTYFQHKGIDFSHILCSYYINLCTQANKPKLASDMIVQPSHRLGAWLGMKSNLTLMTSLAKSDDIETMLKVADITLSKGLHVQTTKSLEEMMEVVNKTQNAEHYTAVMNIATQSLKEADLEAFKSKFPKLQEQAVAE